MSAHTPGALEVGYYSTTEEFRAIYQHAAVMRADRSLVAVTGPSTGKGAMDALEFARLFAAAPDLLAACEAAAGVVDEWAEDLSQDAGHADAEVRHAAVLLHAHAVKVGLELRAAIAKARGQ